MKLHALDVRLVSLEGRRRHVLQVPVEIHGDGAADLVAVANPLGQCVDEGKDALLPLTLDALGGNHLAARGVLQADADTDGVARLDEAPDQRVRHPRFLGHSLDDLEGGRPPIETAHLLEDLVEPRRPEDP